MTREAERSPFQYRPAPLAKQLVRAIGAFPSEKNLRIAHNFIVKARKGRSRTTASARRTCSWCCEPFTPKHQSPRRPAPKFCSRKCLAAEKSGGGRSYGFGGGGR
jgi:hypothetical protein